MYAPEATSASSSAAVAVSHISLMRVGSGRTLEKAWICIVFLQTEKRLGAKATQPRGFGRASRCGRYLMTRTR